MARPGGSREERSSSSTSRDRCPSRRTSRARVPFRIRRVSLRPLRDSGSHHRPADHLANALLQGPQGPEQVPAVHRGDVPGMEGFQRLQVVPVQQMAAVSLQPVQRLERPAEPVDQFVGGEVAEIPGRQRAEETQTDVGRAGPHGQLVAGRLLIVVGREPMGPVSDEDHRTSARSPGPDHAASWPGRRTLGGGPGELSGSGYSRQAISGLASHSSRKGAAAATAAGCAVHSDAATPSEKRLPAPILTRRGVSPADPLD